MKDSLLLNWIVLAPLVGAGILGALALLTAGQSRKPSEAVIGVLGCLGPLLAFILTLSLFVPMVGDGHLIWTSHLLSWIQSGSVQVNLAFTLDRLSGILVLMITFVSTLIHVFSIAYMHADRGFTRYFCYLNLFVSAMLMLVLADNLVGLFLGWEGVGLCSYLLIGFWFKDSQKAAAGTKAFLVNRVGDLGFILGIFFLFRWLGAFDFTTLAAKAHLLSQGSLTLVALLLFIGAIGKSAQIPLHIWLPDAMAGPTPVSALIHAATMVTAGVYMVARLHFLYHAAPDISFLIVAVGALTALMAATIALVQDDIKKVLAYSTISQLGYMFMGVGTGAYAAGVFHLLTHAFFKAALFLGAGAVIHYTHHQQDLRKMGGLRPHLKITYLTMLVATLAIAGMPPLAGFFSKDEILWSLWEHGHYVFWAMGLLTAGLTAFYMFRLFFLVFAGVPRSDIHPAQESSLMNGVLILLALGAALSGLIGLPAVLGAPNWLAHWLEPVLGTHPVPHTSAGVSLLLMGASVLAGGSGILVAYRFYVKGSPVREKLIEDQIWLFLLFRAKYGFDFAYAYGVVAPLKALGTFLWRVVDLRVLDGLVNLVPGLYRGLAQGVSWVQSGYVRAYAYFMLLGLMALFYGYLFTYWKAY